MHILQTVTEELAILVKLKRLKHRHTVLSARIYRVIDIDMYVYLGSLHLFYMHAFLDILVEASVHYIRIVFAFCFCFLTYIFILFLIP